MFAYPDPPLTDGTILLRPWTVHDLSAVEQAGDDPYIPATTTVPAAYMDAEGHQWIERQWQQVTSGTGLPFCVADGQTDSPLGFIGVWLDHRSQGIARFGYWILPSARGRGIASAALRLLSTWAIEEMAVPRLELIVELWNVASQRVAEQAGFIQEGVLHSYIEVQGTRRDVFMYARIASPDRSGEAI
jgi:ribosomal-protein-alanine N-acetyltransferase